MTEAEELADLIAGMIEAARQPGEAPAVNVTVPELDIGSLSAALTAAFADVSAAHREAVAQIVQAMLAREQQAPVSVNIPPLTIDPAPLAEAMVSSGASHADALERSIAGVSGALSAALIQAGQGIVAVDMSGVEAAARAIVQAVTANGLGRELKTLIDGIEEQVTAIRQNTAAVKATGDAVKEQTMAIREQTAALSRRRIIEYDKDGRIAAVRIDF